MNAIAKVGGSLADFRKNMAAFRQGTPRVAAGNVVYLSFSKGEWRLGREPKFDLDSVWVVHPQSFVAGYICWRGGQVFNEVMVGMTAPLPSERDLTPPPPPTGPNDTDGYSLQKGFTAVCIEGDHEGTQAIFKTASDGGLKAVEALLDEMEARLDHAEATGEATVCPVVQFGTDSYPHKKYGKVWVPEITVTAFSDGEPGGEIDWLDEDGGEEKQLAAPPAEPEPPARLRRIKK